MKLFQTETDIKIRAASDKYNAVEEYKKEEAAKRVPYTDATEEMRQQCIVGFSFIDDNIKVFSVERMCMGHAVEEKTLIGYYFAKDVQANAIPTLKEWTFYCSRVQHNELVKAFATAPRQATAPQGKKQLLKG